MPDDLSRYGRFLAELIGDSRVMALGPGARNQAMLPKLKAMTHERLFEGRTIADVQMANAVLAGVWLYHDYFDESHEISQSIETPTGSYWHGIGHRREPDYSNAKYWFRRVGNHPVFEALQDEAVKVGGGKRWDSFAFVDACERAASEGGELERVCREVQMKEWWALLDYCFRHAVG